MKVLVVAAHPDDEVLGCGGTVAHHCHCGDEVHVLIVAEGLTSRMPVRDAEAVGTELRGLMASTVAANAALGVPASNVAMLGLPDNRLDELPRLDVIKAIEDKVQSFLPHTVYTHHGGDLNVDHRRVYEAVVTACRPLPGSSVKRLLCFETVSSTEWAPYASGHFVPNCFKDIGPTWRHKEAALVAYDSEMRPWPHPRSIRALQALSQWRGSTVGLEAAEAFTIVREIG